MIVKIPRGARLIIKTEKREGIMQRKPDNGESTFDKFRSPQAVPVEPEGEILQRMAQSDTYNESERKSMVRSAGWLDREAMGRELFNTQMNSPGASTFSKGRVFDCPEPETSERRKESIKDFPEVPSSRR